MPVVEEDFPLREVFPGEQLFFINSFLSWYSNIFNYLVTSKLPTGWSKAKKDKLRSDARYFIWDNPYLWKLCVNQVMRRCVSKSKFHSILTFCHNVA